jgi:beta-lactamase class A
MRRKRAPRRKWGVLKAAALIFIPAAAIYWGAQAVQVHASGFNPFTSPAISTPVTEPAPLATPSQKAPTVQDTAPAPALTPAPKTPSPPPAKAPAPAVQATPGWAKATQLQAAVAGATKDFPGRYSVVVQDLKTGQRWSVGADERYHPASTIKMPVSLYALEQHRAGKLGWEDLITYTQADFESPGGGAFETAPFGGRYPVSNLVGRALKYSNNVAVNMLGRHLGWQNIRDWTKRIGGELYRQPDGTPEVTPLSELGWWLHLEKLSRQDPKNAELVLQPLREVEYNGRIAAGLPKGVAFVHKFGSYDGYFHDGGWIMGEKPFLLVVMTHGAEEGEADQAIARVAAEVYKVMVQ